MFASVFLIIKWRVILYALVVLIRYLIKKTFWGSLELQNEISCREKIILVTGANSGTGKAATLGFAERNATVIMACRSESKAKEAERWIRKRTWRGDLISMKLDLASLSSIREFVKEFQGRFDKLDILVNNAGIMGNPEDKMKTKDGFEIHMGVNHLGHFLLTNLLLESLINAGSARVVMVTSMAYSRTTLDIDDLFSERSPVPKSYIPFSHHYYLRSKFANALFNKELAKRLEGTGVTCYALCPGPVNSNIAEGRMGSGPLNFVLKRLLQIPAYFIKTIEEGADTILYCALNKGLAGESGDMYQNCGRWGNKNKGELLDKDAQKLWDVSAKLADLK